MSKSTTTQMSGSALSRERDSKARRQCHERIRLVKRENMFQESQKRDYGEYPIEVLCVIDGARFEARPLDGSGQSFREVRLYGIDAPEVGQESAREATEYLRHLTASTAGSLWMEIKSIDLDGQQVAIVHINTPDETLNRAMVEAGWAYWHSDFDPDNALGLQEAQRRASTDERGVWQDGGFEERLWNYRDRLRRERDGRQREEGTRGSKVWAVYGLVAIGIPFLTVPVNTWLLDLALPLAGIPYWIVIQSIVAGLFFWYSSTLTGVGKWYSWLIKGFLIGVVYNVAGWFAGGIFDPERFESLSISVYFLILLGIIIICGLGWGIICCILWFVKSRIKEKAESTNSQIGKERR